MSLVIIEKDELTNIIQSAVREAVKNTRNMEAETRLYSINKVAKLTNRSHRFIKQAVDAGLLKVNGAGLISEVELRRFINGE